MALPSQQRVPSRSTLLRPSMEGVSKRHSAPRWVMLGVAAVVLVLVVAFAAAKRYQVAHGSWPTSLNELASQSGPSAVAKDVPAQAQPAVKHRATQDGAMILRNVSTKPKAHSASQKDGIGATYQPGVNIPLVTSSSSVKP